MKRGFEEKRYNLRSCGSLKKKKSSPIYETAASTERVKNKKKKKKQATEVPPSFLPQIPFDVIPNILQKLPLKSLCRFKCVSKLWCSLILTNFHQSQRKPIFVEHSGPKNVTLDPVESRPIYSVDGNGIPKLICNLSIPTGFPFEHINDMFYYHDSTHVFVCNMFTQEQIRLPRNKRSFKDDKPFFEFGFDPLSMKYKMLCLAGYPLDCQVCTLGTRRWRPVTRLPIHGCGRPSTSSLCFNGTIYWYSNTNMIITFNLADESFGVIPGPNRVTSRPAWVMYVFEFEGCLCLADNRGEFPRTLDLWMLKDYNIENNNAGAWFLMKTIYLSAPDTQWTDPYSTRTGEIVIAEDYYCGKYLYLYSFLTQRVDTIEVVGLPSDFILTNYIQNSVT